MQHFHDAASCEQQPEGRPWEVAGVDMFAVLWPLDQTPQAVIQQNNLSITLYSLETALADDNATYSHTEIST